MAQLALLGGEPIQKDPFGRYNEIGKEEEMAALEVFKTRVLSDFHGTDDDRFLGGEFVREFEKNFAKKFGVKHVVSFNSATTALQAAVIACGIGPGDEVITTPLSMSATPVAILMAGAVPVFADVDRRTTNIDPKDVARKLTERTKAIFVTDLFGGSCEFDELQAIADEHDLFLLEDNAQGAGGMYRGKYLGAVGDAGVFSFNVHKIIQSGEGGVLVTDDDHIAYRAQLHRNHGEVVVDQRCKKGEAYEPIVGSNYRMSELHAAIADAQLKKLDELVKKRVRLADYLSERLSQFDFLETPYVIPESVHVYFLYSLLFDQEKAGISRKTFAEAMTAEGFPIAQGYLEPLYLQRLYQERKMYPNSGFPFEGSEVSYEKGICPVAEELFEKSQIIVNVIHYCMQSENDVDLFVSGVEKVVSNIDELKGYESKS